MHPTLTSLDELKLCHFLTGTINRFFHDTNNASQMHHIPWTRHQSHQ